MALIPGAGFAEEAAAAQQPVQTPVVSLSKQAPPGSSATQDAHEVSAANSQTTQVSAPDVKPADPEEHATPPEALTPTNGEVAAPETESVPVQAASQTQVELESGDSVEITFSSLPDYIDLSKDPEEANRIPARLLTNPQLADIFVPGLFTPPAAGGPERDVAEQTLSNLAEPLAVNPALTAQQDSAIAAAILFREFVDVKIVPTFLTQDIQNATINAVGR